MFRPRQEGAGQGVGGGEGIPGGEKSRYASHAGPGWARDKDTGTAKPLPCTDRMRRMNHSSRQLEADELQAWSTLGSEPQPGDLGQASETWWPPLSPADGVRVRREWLPRPVIDRTGLPASSPVPEPGATQSRRECPSAPAALGSRSPGRIPGHDSGARNSPAPSRHR